MHAVIAPGLPLARSSLLVQTVKSVGRILFYTLPIDVTVSDLRRTLCPEFRLLSNLSRRLCWAQHCRRPMEQARASCKDCGSLALESTLSLYKGRCMACVRAAQNSALEQLHDQLAKNHGDLFISNPLALPRNKNAEYRAHVLSFSLGVAKAFDELKVAKVCVQQRFDVNPEHFYIAANDLSELGLAFAQTSFMKWIAKTDRWKPASRTADGYKQGLENAFRDFENEKSA